ncbi:hypothetical protein SKAU_G00238390 [Synaphobranchus kaupii]|uniref:ribonuclease H n=1 Tax=Synaphobranchus kaupii TaxID=118154 RepID=A0A9Q1F753_SYNKA|nr:hypothetical protein SKAU_G00238390 [Synaphobranchus kaupii]
MRQMVERTEEPDLYIASVQCPLPEPEQQLNQPGSHQTGWLRSLLHGLVRPHHLWYQTQTVREKEVTRSKRDQEAISLLESKTMRVEVDGVLRYATPLLRMKTMPHLRAAKEAEFLLTSEGRRNGGNLNEWLLPGPTLLGVLLRFWEHTVAFTSDIKGMFHQVQLLPEDRSLLRLIWRDMKRDAPVSVYEWTVLPFGTTCSPCCATFALQRHVLTNSKPEEDVCTAIERHFYVDNWLQSLTTAETAKDLVDKQRALLVAGGFAL